MRLRSAQMAHQIKASVCEVRRTLFGQPSAPFASLPEANKWIEGEVQQLYEGIAPWARALYQPLWDHALVPSPQAIALGTPETLQRLAVLLEAVRTGTIGWVAPAEHGGLKRKGAMAWWMRRSADSSATYESSHEPVDLHRQTSLPISWQISHLFWSQPRSASSI